ncbi:MAG: response regulator [Dehalococcoidia bacterium]
MKPVHPAAILVVDDDSDHAQIARIVLRSIAPGIPVDVCGSSALVLDAASELPRDTLVLMDRILHGRESFGAIVELRAARPDVWVVLLSAALSSVDRAYAIACGAYEAMEKPGSLDGWREMLGSVVAHEPAATAPSRRPTRAA